MPWEESLANMRTLDRWRSAIGLRYPGDETPRARERTHGNGCRRSEEDRACRSRRLRACCPARATPSEETRRVVLDAARELGYVPNQIARSLRTRQTTMVGLLIGDVENSFYSVIAKNVESVTKGCRVPRRPLQQRRRPQDRARVPEAARGHAGRRADRDADLEEPPPPGALMDAGHRRSCRSTGGSRGWTRTRSSSTTRPVRSARSPI